MTNAYENSEQASRESSFAGDNKDMSIKDLTVKDRRKDKNKIFIKLRIPDSTGFCFSLLHSPVNTSLFIASFGFLEMQFVIYLQVMFTTFTFLSILELTHQPVLLVKWLRS